MTTSPDDCAFRIKLGSDGGTKWMSFAEVKSSRWLSEDDARIVSRFGNSPALRFLGADSLSRLIKRGDASAEVEWASRYGHLFPVMHAGEKQSA